MNLSLLNVIIPAIALICYLFLMLVFFYSKKNKVRKLYSVYLVFMSIWSLGSLCMRLNISPGALFWNRVLCTGIIAIPILFYHFSLLYTESTKGYGLLKLGYLSSIVLFVLNIQGYIVKTAYIWDKRLVYEMGSVSPFLALWGVTYMFLAIFNIVYQIKIKKIFIDKVKFILFGMICSLLGTLLNFQSNIGQYPVDIAVNTVNAILIAYSIYRYRFLGTRLIIRKTIQTLSSVIIQTALYFVIFYLIDKIIKDSHFYVAMISALIMSVINAVIAHYFREMIRYMIDSLFYKDRIDQKKALREFSENINSNLEIKDITSHLIKVIHDTIQSENVYIYLNLEDGENFTLVRHLEDLESFKEISMNKNNPIAKWFEYNNLLTIEEINDNSYFKGLWSMEKNMLNAMGADVLVPIKLRDSLIGIIIITEKVDGTKYQKDDMDILLTISNGTAAVIENARNYSKAKVQAITDGLTELYNHRHFYECLEDVIFNNRYEKFSVVMLDVDYFKFYNDLYGHSAGDKALKKIADILKLNIGNKGILARYGGEEFSLILPNLSAKETYEIIDKVRLDIQSSFNKTNEVNAFLTISAGISNYPENTTNKEILLEEADKALYYAKRNGRNRCIIYDEKIEDRDLKKDGEDILFSSVYALAAAIDAKDHYTFGHSENVSKYGVMLGKELGFNDEQLDIMRNAGLLHDVGKIGVPESILTKPGKLTAEEYETMKKHVELSVDIFKHIPNLIKVIPAVICHHERYDGKGYPRGIKGSNIPIEGRCLTIVDSFEAMISRRPYKKPLSLEEAVNELRANKGTQFDPNLTDIFIEVIEKNKSIFLKDVIK